VSQNIQRGVVLVIFIVTLIVIGSALGVRDRPSVSFPSVSPTTTVAATPTATPAPTLSPFPTATDNTRFGPSTRPSGAVLGGALSAFDARFGPESAPDSWNNVAFNGQPIQITVSTSPSPDGSVQSVDVQTRVYSVFIDLSAASGVNPLDVCRQFAPKDAKTAGTYGSEHVYTSAQLASAFTAASFTNSLDQRLQRGAFSIVSDNTSCGIATGIG
jgi:hypothetical protein